MNTQTRAHTRLKNCLESNLKTDQMRKQKNAANYIHFIGPAVAIVSHVIGSTVIRTRNAIAVSASYCASTTAIVTVRIVASRRHIDGLRWTIRSNTIRANIASSTVCEFAATIIA